MTTILIFGSDEERHARHVYEALQAMGETPYYWDTRKAETGELSFAFDPQNPQAGYLMPTPGLVLPLSHVKSVYWRTHYGVHLQPAVVNDLQAGHLAYLKEREWTCGLESLYRSMAEHCLWVNDWQAIAMHQHKPYQLQCLAQNGLRVPRTLITNSAHALGHFAQQAPQQSLIFKPVLGGGHTAPLNAEALAPERLEDLPFCPVTFQEQLEGVDVRVYGLQDELFAAEIHANSLDFREDENARLVPIELPPSVQADCRKVMELLGLVWTAIDLRYNPTTGEYVFIEANPSPMFIHFERQTGFPLTQRLCEWLAKGLTGAMAS